MLPYVRRRASHKERKDTPFAPKGQKGESEYWAGVSRWALSKSRLTKSSTNSIYSREA
jgi:hypothetical protein